MNGIIPGSPRSPIRFQESQKISEVKANELHLTADQIHEIKQILHENYKADEPGCTCAIIQEGNIIWEESIGVAEPGKNMRTSDMPQHLGSVSKQFTAMCVALLIDRGQINLDEDIRQCIPSTRHFPEFKGPDGEPVVIRVKDLLHMQSGLPTSEAIVEFNGFKDEDLNNDEKMVLVKNYLEKNPTLPFKPGEKYAYCNTNYILLADLVSAKSNQPFIDFAQNEIFNKLNMTKSRFIKPTGNDEMMKGYRRKDGSWEECTTHNRTAGPCGVLSTAADMAKWDGIFSTSTLGNHPERVLEIMRGPLHPPQNVQNSWQGTKFKDVQYLGGLSVGRSVDDHYAVEVHPGGIEGFEAIICRIRSLVDDEKPVTIFIACNRAMSSNQEGKNIGGIAIAILKQCLKNNLALIEPIKLSTDNDLKTPIFRTPLDTFAGTYHNPISGGECKLVPANDKLNLLISTNVKPLTFKRLTENAFQTPDGIKIEFRNGNFLFDDGNTLRNLTFTRSA